MSQAQLYLFGSPRLEQDGQPIEMDTRKAMALVAYLAITGVIHSRDALATLLWPEFESARARAALRRTLSSLKKALGDRYLEITREAIGKNPDVTLWVDVAHFHHALAARETHGHPDEEVCTRCLAPLGEASALYRGDFLEGFTLRDSPNFDEWQFFQTDNLRRKYTGVLEKLARAHAGLSEFEQAIAYAHRWLAMDPLREEAHRTLMSLYAWANQRNAALHQYRECVRVLEQELGVPPLDETTDLYQAIMEQRHPPPPAPLVRQPSLVSAGKPTLAVPTASTGLSRRPDYPLVGRSAQWASLVELYNSVGPDGRFVVLEGEAGIGKTRLGEELVAHVRSKGGYTLGARCYEGEAELAYAPFIEGLRIAVAGAGALDRLRTIPPMWVSEAVRLLPEMLDEIADLPSPPPQEGSRAQLRFFEGIAQVIQALCTGPAPGILFLDDVHWADDATLELIAYLVRRLRGRPIFILLTWRPEDVPRGHGLHGLLVQSRRDGSGTVVSLPRLAKKDIMALVQAIDSQDLPGGLIESLFQETEGLPFFVVEYLTGLSVDRESGEAIDWALPGSVRNLLHDRLARVSETGTQLLAGAAVIGRSFDYDTLRTASGRSEDETVTGLEELLRQGLVREVGGDQDGESPVYDFAHDQLRRLVYQETSLARLRLLHRRVAETLQARAIRPKEAGALAGQIAHHFRLAGQEASAAEYFLKAGDHARELYANHEALAHYRAALALDHPEPGILHMYIGDLQILMGDFDAARASFETAAALCPPENLNRVEHKLGGVYDRLGEWELAESHYQAALMANPGLEQPDRDARVYADWSLSTHRRGQADRAGDFARRALEQAENARDGHALAQAHNILGVLARGRNDLDSARHHLEHSLALGEQLQDPGIRIAALNNLGLVQQSDGDLEEARALMLDALELCISVGDRHRAAALHNNLADLLHLAGQTEEAMEHLKQAVVIFSEIGGQPGEWQPEIWKLVEW